MTTQAGWQWSLGLFLRGINRPRHRGVLNSTLDSVITGFRPGHPARLADALPAMWCCASPEHVRASVRSFRALETGMSDPMPHVDESGCINAIRRWNFRPRRECQRARLQSAERPLWRVNPIPSDCVPSWGKAIPAGRRGDLWAVWDSSGKRNVGGLSWRMTDQTRPPARHPNGGEL